MTRAANARGPRSPPAPAVGECSNEGTARLSHRAADADRPSPPTSPEPRPPPFPGRARAGRNPRQTIAKAASVQPTPIRRPRRVRPLERVHPSSPCKLRRCREARRSRREDGDASRRVRSLRPVDLRTTLRSTYRVRGPERGAGATVDAYRCVGLTGARSPPRTSRVGPPRGVGSPRDRSPPPRQRTKYSDLELLADWPREGHDRRLSAADWIGRLEKPSASWLCRRSSGLSPSHGLVALDHAGYPLEQLDNACTD